jgi:hypothetical protein
MYTKQQFVQIVKGMADIIGDEKIAPRTCLDCKFFEEKSERCGKWNAKPPARTIVNGCAAYVEMEIPF